jgi:hypothetical protein
MNSIQAREALSQFHARQAFESHKVVAQLRHNRVKNAANNASSDATESKARNLAASSTKSETSKSSPGTLVRRIALLSFSR